MTVTINITSFWRQHAPPKRSWLAIRLRGTKDWKTAMPTQYTVYPTTH